MYYFARSVGAHQLKIHNFSFEVLYFCLQILALGLDTVQFSFRLATMRCLYCSKVWTRPTCPFCFWSLSTKDAICLRGTLLRGSSGLATTMEGDKSGDGREDLSIKLVQVLFRNRMCLSVVFVECNDEGRFGVGVAPII